MNVYNVSAGHFFVNTVVLMYANGSSLMRKLILVFERLPAVCLSCYVLTISGEHVVFMVQTN